MRHVFAALAVSVFALAQAQPAATPPAPQAPATQPPATQPSATQRPAPAPAPPGTSADPAAGSEDATRHAKRAACRKDARDKKLVGADRTAYIKECTAAP